MPDTLRKDLVDLVCTTVDAHFAARIASLAASEPARRDTRIDYLRQIIDNAPGDFPNYAVRVERMTHSGWSRSGSLAGDRSDYVNGTDEFPVIRSARIVVTVKEEMSDDAAEADQNVGDEVVNAIYAAGPVLGTAGDALGVTDTGEPVVESRETRSDENPQPGMVHTVTFEITCQQWGRALRTAVNTI